MALNFHPRLLTILAVLLVLSQCYDAGSTSPPRRLGGYQPVEPNEPRVIEVAKYAVTKHNHQAHTNFEFEKVVEAQRQVVAGFNYKLVIKVKFVSVAGYPHLYDALVFQGLNGTNDFHLRHFKQLIVG